MLPGEAEEGRVFKGHAGMEGEGGRGGRKESR